MLDPGSGNTSEASNLELRINDTAQDSIPGMQRFAVWRSQHQRNRMLSNVGTYGSVGALGGNTQGHLARLQEEDRETPIGLDHLSRLAISVGDSGRSMCAYNCLAT